MKKNYTDSDIKKLLQDLAEFVPEIDVNDTEWGTFLREFIAARPDVKMDESFAVELREQLLRRAENTSIYKKKKFPLWLKFTTSFAFGAGVCAAVLVPILQVPEVVHTEENAAPMMMRGMKSMPQVAMDMADENVESLTLRDADKIPEFELAPMMAKEVAEPVMFQSVPEEEDAALMAGAGMLNSEVGIPQKMMMDGAFNSRMAIRQDQLAWDKMPSDAELLRVATAFFEKHNFDALGDVTPRIDKWWENGEEMDWKPEFAPDRVGVVFSIGNGLEDIRIDVETRTLRVVWMSYNQSRR